MDQESMKSEFLRAYEQHADEIYRFTYFKVSSKERAEDLTQEVFTELWQELRKNELIKNTRAFLFTVARNRVIDWYRKKKSSSLEVITESGIEFSGDGSDSVTQHAEFFEALSAIEELDDASKEVVLLRHVEGWSPQEIAMFTGESANVISVRLTRAMKKLQELLHVNK